MESPKDSASATTQSESLQSQNYLGLLLKDRYLIERVLGRGGLGAVYLARDRQLLNRPVVIKVLIAERGEEHYNNWFQKKFKQEMEALARINHPGVVGVLDTGEMPDGKPFLVMQYVEGVTLRSVMINQGMDFNYVANIVRQIGQALSAAHAKGVYHRDLKPENIMLEEVGGGHQQVKLIDFGVARIKDSEVATDVEITWIAGTPPYMAPEQLRGRPTAESDVYGFGAVVYEMLTGHPPFKAGSAVDLYELQREGALVKPSEARKNLPEEAEAAILKALSFNATDRYQSARDFAEELAAALTGEPMPVFPVSTPEVRSSLKTISAEAQPTAPDDTLLFDEVKSSNPPKPKKDGQKTNNSKWIWAAAALLIIAVAGVWMINRPSGKSPQTTPPAELKAERAFSYWMVVQKYRDGQRYQSPFRLTGEINFENDYHVRLHVNSARDGFLYIINEAPEPVNGLPEYVTLFPSSTANNGSAQLAANRQIAIPERGDGFFFDKDQGTEKLWLIWSAQSLPELERLKSLANPQDKGLVTNPAQIRSVRDLIARFRAEQLPVVQKDENNRQTDVSGTKDVIAHLINLEHH